MKPTKENIKDWCFEIEEAIKLQIDNSNPDELMGKLNSLSNLTGLSSQTVAISEQLYNERLGELVMAKEYSKMGATEKKMLFASLASDEIYLMTLSERLNRALVHSGEFIRSILSALKTEMQMAKTMST